MGRFNFNGELAQLRQRQVDFISEILEKQGFNGPDVTIENVGIAGDNYIADVKRIVITENGKTFKMIAKVAPENQIMRLMANIEMMFRNEHVIYTELLPKFIQMQKSVGIPDEELFRYAECYGFLSEAPNELILLEDLKESKFDILDRFKALSNDSVKLALKNFATFHSLSYALKHNEPESFAEIKAKFGDIYKGGKANSENIKKYFQGLENTTIAMLTDEKYIKATQGSVIDLFNLHVKTCKPDIDGKHSVILQGDGWTNNIMFKCQDDIPSECILIDYQMAKENNPCFDVMYMLFNSTDHEQRLKHYQEFIDYYHKELDSSLQNYGLKAALVYPRDQLDCDMKRYGKLMFGTCIMVSNAILKNVEDAVKMKEAMNTTTPENMDQMMKSMFEQHPETIKLFKARVEGLLDSFLEFGLL